jgi:hypothetical protein
MKRIDKITVEFIPHKRQRYPTCGDWYFRGKTLVIRVSKEMGLDSGFLVAMHELIEVWKATKRGVTVKEVDNFDIQYEKEHRRGGKLNGKRIDESEPGNDPRCPVFEEHQVATAIETLLCSFLGLSWAKHNRNVNKLP